MEESPCPVSGVYTGLIPDETTLCAKLSNECEKPETMHYAVQVRSHFHIHSSLYMYFYVKAESATLVRTA